ncbi:hypothetical protein TSAR_004755 [Trichomalopsis sarcophagae]|uniref:Uncharacterized protein n=1 Tax=Trichomalopsis sarcophagae TaxID=543379 RepID=A0A232FJZ8_9HYME|nr:hypothetical protein TSAR_004755 [Trichomalopsis sarcophagae]
MFLMCEEALAVRGSRQCDATAVAPLGFRTFCSRRETIVVPWLKVALR